MTILDYSIILFIILESLNVGILYFFPESRLGNGVAVFTTYFKLKENREDELFTSYLVNWVAGTKLIFIVLLIVVVIVGNEPTKFWAVVAMILSIGTYFWRLHKIIKELDHMGHINPKGYSKSLDVMILSFLTMFIGALFIYLL